MIETAVRRINARFRSLHRRARGIGALRRGGRFISRLLGGALTIGTPALALLAGGLLPDDPGKEPKPGKDGVIPNIEQIIATALMEHDKTNPHNTHLTLMTNEQGAGPDRGPGGGAWLSRSEIERLIQLRLSNINSGGGPTINLHAPIQNVLRLGSTAEEWYRTSLGAGDYFWALPMPNFSLRASATTDCPSIGTCGQIDLRSDWLANAANSTPLIIMRDGEWDSAPNAVDPGVCQELSGTGVWGCALENTSTDEDLCLWLRKSPAQPGDPQNAMTFELRWTKKAVGNPPRGAVSCAL